MTGRHNDFLCKTWFDFAKEFNCGTALVGFKEDNFDYPNWHHSSKPIQDEYNIDKVFYNKMPIGFYSNPFSKPEKYKYNFINIDGKYISDVWFDDTNDFTGRYAPVCIGEKWNFINYKGEYLSKEWFDGVSSFGDISRDIAIVYKKDEEICMLDDIYDKPSRRFQYSCGYQENIINSDGELLMESWADRIYSVGSYNTLVKVTGNKYQFIDINGQPIYDQIFDCIQHLDGKYCNVKLNGKYNVFNVATKQFSFVQWMDEIRQDDYFKKNYEIEIRSNGKRTLAKYDGTIVFDGWYDKIIKNNGVIITIKNNGKFNFINKDFELMYPEWFDGYIFLNNLKDYAYVWKGKEKNIVNGFGLTILDYNPDDITPMLYNRFFKIIQNNKSNYLYCDSDKLISDEWFDSASRVSANGECIYVKRDNEFYRITIKGKLEKIDRK